MTEKIVILVLPLIFLGTFITRNLIVKARTKKRIRASDPLLTASMVFSSLSIFITIVSTYRDDFYRAMGPILFLRGPVISFFGLLLNTGPKLRLRFA